MANTEQKQREAVKMNRTSLFCVAIGFLVAFSGVSVAQDLGCEAEVTLDGGVIEVAASSAGGRHRKIFNVRLMQRPMAAIKTSI
jgi:hypothetical protein